MSGKTLTLHPSKVYMSTQPQNPSAHKRILIVDDESGIRDLLDEILSIEGYITTTASTGDEAIAKSREQQFDLALIDLLMPGTSGAVVVRVMSEESPGTPLVIVTGSDEVTIENELGNLEVNGVIKKPFVMHEVLSVVAEFTGGP